MGILLLSLSITIGFKIGESDIQAKRTRAREVGNAFAQQINRDLYNGLERVQSLEKMVYDNNGKVKNFKDSAKLLKRSYIDSSQW